MPAASGIAPIVPALHNAGRALPAKHFGSGAIFLEAIEPAELGAVLVIDNAGHRNEGCIGDLTAVEAKSAEIAAITVWEPIVTNGTTPDRFCDLKVRRVGDVRLGHVVVARPRKQAIEIVALAALARFFWSLVV